MSISESNPRWGQAIVGGWRDIVVKELRVRNFQSVHVPTSLPIAPLTFLYGPNSAGKSLVADAMDFLREYWRGDKGYENAFSALSNFWHRTNEGLRIEEPLEIGMTFMIPCDDSFYYTEGINIPSDADSDYSSFVIALSEDERSNIEVKILSVFEWSKSEGEFQTKWSKSGGIFQTNLTRL